MGDALAKFVGSLEGAVRYLLTGSTITIIALLSGVDVPAFIEPIQSNVVPVVAIVALVGFGAFTLYRLVMWTLLDPISWKLGWSVPSLEKGAEWPYAYARYLRWRYAPSFPTNLVSYLGYRWSATHYALLSGSVAIVARFLAEPESLTDRYPWAMLAFGIVYLSVGLAQCIFLFRVERELNRDTSATHDA